MIDVRLRFAFVILGVAVSGFAGCTKAPTVDLKARAEQRSLQPVAVRTVSVTLQDVRRTSSQPATVHAFYESTIRARVTGYVSSVTAEIGDVVEAGEVLAKVDIPEMRQQRAVSVARVKRQKAEVSRARAGVKLAKANVVAVEALEQEARSRLQQADATLAAAEAEFQRTQDLVNRGSVQPRLLDEARKRRDSERAGLSAVQSSIASSEANVSVAKASLEAAVADVTAAEAETIVQESELLVLEEMLSFASVRSPYDGIVTHRHIAPGDLAVAGEDAAPLFRISQVDRVRVQVPVPEKDAAYINVGDALKLSFPFFQAEADMEASVTRQSQSLDPATRMMMVEAEIENTDGKLIPGMFGQAQITLGASTASLMLPARAVRFSEDGSAYVYAVENEIVEVLSVVTGVDNGLEIEIVSGASENQSVIDAHIQRFSNGQKVAVLQ